MKKYFSHLLLPLILTLCLIGCGKDLPNPVKKLDNDLYYIPIADTAFLIPRSTWLESYSRNSTDGMVKYIIIHATAPDVAPWDISERGRNNLYPNKVMGRTIEIWIDDTDLKNYYLRFESSGSWFKDVGWDFIEEPSDQAKQGLRQFRRLHYRQTSEEDISYRAYCSARGITTDECEGTIARLKSNSGKPIMDKVYYEFIENGKIKYLGQDNQTR